MALAASFVSTHVYYASLGEGEEEVMEEGLAWTIVGALSGGWICSFLAILMLMQKRYWRTFFSRQTGREWVRSLFEDEGRSDLVKIMPLGFNKRLWAPIREDVKEWTLEKWTSWEEEQPDWFQDAWKETLDDDMIPRRSLAEMNGGGLRRRSSLGNVFGSSASSRRKSSSASSRRRSSGAVQPVIEG